MHHPWNINTKYSIGNHIEYETQALITTLRRYFYAGSTRVAMRIVDGIALTHPALPLPKIGEREECIY